MSGWSREANGSAVERRAGDDVSPREQEVQCRTLARDFFSKIVVCVRDVNLMLPFLNKYN
jgi:hypothetical protein